MRKFLVIALSIMMLFAFTACDEKDEGTAPAGTPIATSAEFSSAITNGGTYYLSDDLTAESETAFQIAKDLTLNLNGKKLSTDKKFIVSGETEFTIENGTLDIRADGSSVDATLTMQTDSSLVLDHVVYTSDGCAVFTDKNQQNVSITVTDSEISGAAYGIGTNATAPESADVSIIVKRSEISAETEDGDNAAILFNVKGSVVIENSTVTGGKQALIARGGTHTISDSTFIATGKNSLTNEYTSGNWGSGNNIPFGAIVIGNRSSSYQYETTVTLNDVTITAPEKNEAEKTYYEIYVWQNDNQHKVTVSGTDVKSTNTFNTNEGAMNGPSYSVAVTNAD